MPKTLKTYVTVYPRDDDGRVIGAGQTFGPDDKLPDWARKQISNSDVWEGEDDEGPETALSRMKKDELQARATELEIEFDPKATNDELRHLIEDKLAADEAAGEGDSGNEE